MLVLCQYCKSQSNKVDKENHDIKLANVEFELWKEGSDNKQKVVTDENGQITVQLILMLTFGAIITILCLLMLKHLQDIKKAKNNSLKSY